MAIAELVHGHFDNGLAMGHSYPEEKLNRDQVAVNFSLLDEADRPLWNLLQKITSSFELAQISTLGISQQEYLRHPSAMKGFRALMRRMMQVGRSGFNHLINQVKGRSVACMCREGMIRSQIVAQLLQVNGIDIVSNKVLDPDKGEYLWKNGVKQFGIETIRNNYSFDDFFKRDDRGFIYPGGIDQPIDDLVFIQDPYGLQDNLENWRSLHAMVGELNQQSGPQLNMHIIIANESSIQIGAHGYDPNFSTSFVKKVKWLSGY